MKKYSIKPNEKLNRELLIYGLIMFIFIIITYLSIDIDEDIELLILVSSIIIICYSVLFLFPVFILQANYSKYNKKTELVLLKDYIIINNETIQLDSIDRKSTRLNSSHVRISYAVFCLKKKNIINKY